MDGLEKTEFAAFTAQEKRSFFLLMLGFLATPCNDTRMTTLLIRDQRVGVLVAFPSLRREPHFVSPCSFTPTPSHRVLGEEFTAG